MHLGFESRNGAYLSQKAPVKRGEVKTLNMGCLVQNCPILVNIKKLMQGIYQRVFWD